MKNITFSIICPLYNKERYIKDTIESVIKQKYQNWELLIIDDGSSDNSLEIVKEYVSDKIKLLLRKDFSENKGGSVSRNIGISQASGSHLLFLDADDILAEYCLEQRREYILKYPDFKFYIFDIIHFRSDIKNIQENKFYYFLKKINYIFSPKSRLYFLTKFLKYDTQWSICNTIWEIGTLKELGGFSENFQRLQDPEIHTRALIDEENTFKFLKYETKPDVFVRLDQDRSSTISHFELYLRLSSSIEAYILQVYSLLVARKQVRLVKYLNAYILLFEQVYSGYSANIGEEDKKEYVYVRDEFYKKIDLLLNSENKQVVRLYRFLAKFKIAREFRIPAIYVYFYKMWLT